MRQKKRDGFSLVEVLVSLLVVAVGVIGAAGMQMTALRTSRESGFQSLAVQLASEMAEKMRTSGAHSFSTDYRSTEGEPAPAGSCYAKACSSEELMAFYLHEWEQRVKAGLPAGRARICRDASPWDAVHKAFKWDCSGDAGAGIVIKLGWQARNPDGSLIRDGGGTLPPAVVLAAEVGDR